MSTRRIFGVSGVLMVLSALTMGLPGCGGGAQETGPTGEVKLAPVTNPAPGVVPVDEEYKQQTPAAK
jgi:hypothetical protein